MAGMERRALIKYTSATVAGGAITAGQAQAAPLGRRAHRRHENGRRYVVAHRGASGYRPEHTLEAYRLAVAMGADFIEPDLCITRDGVLVVRHEPEISETTDVSRHPEFAGRRATKSVDGHDVTGWFVEDFTLAELRTLRAVERMPKLRQHNTIYDGLWPVATFEEVLRLREKLSRQYGRTIGIFPETKHPTYFRAQGRPLEEQLVPLVRKYGLDRPGAPIFIQSFELENLLALRERFGVRAPLVFRPSRNDGPFGDSKGRSYAELTTRAGMATYAAAINGLGPDLKMVLPWEAGGRLGAPTSFVEDAHVNGLSVCPWEIRPENSELPVDYRVGTNPSDHGRVLEFTRLVWQTGVDGLFADTPDIAVLARSMTFGR